MTRSSRILSSQLRLFLCLIAMRSYQCTGRTTLPNGSLRLSIRPPYKSYGSPHRAVPPAARNTAVFTKVHQAPALTCPPPVAPLRSSGRAVQKQTKPSSTSKWTKRTDPPCFPRLQRRQSRTDLCRLFRFCLVKNSITFSSGSLFYSYRGIILRTLKRHPGYSLPAVRCEVTGLLNTAHK